MQPFDGNHHHTACPGSNTHTLNALILTDIIELLVDITITPFHNELASQECLCVRAVYVYIYILFILMEIDSIFPAESSSARIHNAYELVDWLHFLELTLHSQDIVRLVVIHHDDPPARSLL